MQIYYYYLNAVKTLIIGRLLTWLIIRFGSVHHGGDKKMHAGTNCKVFWYVFINTIHWMMCYPLKLLIIRLYFIQTG